MASMTRKNPTTRIKGAKPRKAKENHEQAGADVEASPEVSPEVSLGVSAGVPPEGFLESASGTPASAACLPGLPNTKIIPSTTRTGMAYRFISTSLCVGMPVNDEVSIKEGYRGQDSSSTCLNQ
jgi:hypothetical protein